MESANFIKRILKARTRTSYGIAVYEDRENKEKLSEIHLEEAVQDFLTENN